MKKKFITALLCAAMTASMLAGCGSNNGGNSGGNDANADANAVQAMTLMQMRMLMQAMTRKEQAEMRTP